MYEFVSKILDGVEVRALSSQVSPPQTGKTVSLWTWLCALRHCHDERGKGPSQNCCHNVGSTLLLSKISLYLAAFRFPLIGAKSPCPISEKQPQTKGHNHMWKGVASYIWPNSIVVAIYNDISSVVFNINKQYAKIRMWYFALVLFPGAREKRELCRWTVTQMKMWGRRRKVITEEQWSGRKNDLGSAGQCQAEEWRSFTWEFWG